MSPCIIHLEAEIIKILSDSEPGTLSVSISGKLVHDDAARLESELQLRADRESDFNLIVELSDIDGLEASVVRDDLMFAKKTGGDIGKMAVVGRWSGASCSARHGTQTVPKRRRVDSQMP